MDEITPDVVNGRRMIVLDTQLIVTQTSVLPCRQENPEALAPYLMRVITVVEANWADM